MGEDRAWWIVGVVLWLAVPVLAASGCGEVTPVDVEQSQSCAKPKKGCEDGDCTERGQKKQGAAAGAGASGSCSTGSAGMGGATGNAGSSVGMAGASGSSGGATLTDTYDPACALCARAEACCKAEGLTDCNYAAACANASNAEKAAYYMTLCRLILNAASSGTRTPPDVCGM